QIVIDPQQPATIYVGLGQSISKSTDGGKTWAVMLQGIPPGIGGAGYLVIDPFHPQTLLAAFNSIDYITHDGAQHWSQVILPDDHRSSGTRFSALFDPFTPGTF